MTTAVLARNHLPPSTTTYLAQSRDSSRNSSSVVFSHPMEGSERHQLQRPTKEVALACFGTPSVRKACRAIARCCQRDLQQLFSQIYQEPARSNNNVWLRKKLLEAIGGSMRYSEPPTVRRKARKPSARSPAAAAPALHAAAIATAREGPWAFVAPGVAVPSGALEGEAPKSSSFSTHTEGSTPRTTSANSEGTGCSPVALRAPAMVLRPVRSRASQQQQHHHHPQQAQHEYQAQQSHWQQPQVFGSLPCKPDPGLWEAATASSGEPTSLGPWLYPALSALPERDAAANGSRHPHLPPLTPLPLPVPGRSLPTPPGLLQQFAAAVGPAMGAGSSSEASLAQLRQVSAGTNAGSGTSSRTATPFSSLPPNLAAMLGGVSWPKQEPEPAATRGPTATSCGAPWDPVDVLGFQAGASTAAVSAGAAPQQPPGAGFAEIAPGLSLLCCQQVARLIQPAAGAAAGVELGAGLTSLAGPTGQLPVLRQASWPGAASQDGAWRSAISHSTSLPAPVTLPTQMAGIKQEWGSEAGLGACGPELCMEPALPAEPLLAAEAEAAGPQWAAPSPAAEAAGQQWAAPPPTTEGLVEGLGGLVGLDLGSSDLPWGDAELVGSPTWPAEPNVSPTGEVGSPAAHLFGCWWSFQL